MINIFKKAWQEKKEACRARHLARTRRQEVFETILQATVSGKIAWKINAYNGRFVEGHYRGVALRLYRLEITEPCFRTIDVGEEPYRTEYLLSERQRKQFARAFAHDDSPRLGEIEKLLTPSPEEVGRALAQNWEIS